MAYGLLGAAYLFNGAVVHALNRQSDRAVDSALLRAGGVFVGVGTTIAVIVAGKCFQGSVNSSGILPSTGASNVPAYCYVGVSSLFVFPLAALAIDDAVLTRARIEEPLAPHSSVAPTLVVKPGLALLGLGASF